MGLKDCRRYVAGRRLGFYISAARYIPRFRHGARSSPEGHSRKVLGYFNLNTTLLHPPHAILIRLNKRYGNYIVILIPETADLLGM